MKAQRSVAIKANSAVMTACPNCGSPVPGEAKECSDCGRLFSAVWVEAPVLTDTGKSEVTITSDPISHQTNSAETPGGVDLALLMTVQSRWNITDLPGGGTLLSQNGIRDSGGKSATWIVRLGLPLFISFLYFVNGGIGNAGARPILFWAGLILLFTVCLGGIFYTIFRRVEIRVHHGSVERTIYVPGYTRTQRIDGIAVLRVQTSETMASKGRRHQIRRLRAENLGKKIFLDENSESLDFALSEFVGLGHPVNTRPDEMTALANYLSHLTGWPVIDLQKGIF